MSLVLLLAACASGGPLSRPTLETPTKVPKSTSQDLERKVALLAKDRRYDSALDIQTQITKKNPTSDVAHFILGKAHMNLEHIAKAQQRFEQAKALNPQNRSIYDHLNFLNYYKHRLLFPKPFFEAEDVISSISATYKTSMFDFGESVTFANRAVLNAHFIGVEIPFFVFFPDSGSSDVVFGDLEIKLRGFSNSMQNTNHAYTAGIAVVIGTGSEVYGMADNHVDFYGQYGYTFGRFAVTTGLKLTWVDIDEKDRTGASLRYNGMLGWTPWNCLGFVVQALGHSVLVKDYTISRAGLLAGVRLYPSYFDRWQIGVAAGVVELGGDTAFGGIADVAFHY